MTLVGVVLGTLALLRANQVGGKGRAVSLTAIFLGFMGMALYLTIVVLWSVFLWNF